MEIQPTRDGHFKAMKDITRLSWMLNFEAVATVPPQVPAVAKAMR